MSVSRFSLACVCVLWLAGDLCGQQAKVQREVDTRFIPDSAFASATIFPGELKALKRFEAFPREVVTAWSKREIGVDLMEATQITAIAKDPGSVEAFQEGPPNWAVVMHFKTKQTLGGNLMEWLERDDQNDRLYKGDRYRGIPSFLVIDEKTIVMGDERWLVEVRSAGRESDLGKLLKAELTGGGDLVAIVDVKKIRPLLKLMTQEIQPGVPPAIGRMRELPDLIEVETVSVDLQDGSLKMKMTGVDPAAAKRTKKILEQAMSFGADMAVGTIATQMDASDGVQMAGIEYFDRLSGFFQGKLEPKVDGNDVTVEIDSLNIAVVPTLIGMLLPAVQQVRAAARRTQSMNNLRQLALSALNYESAHRHFPTQANYDDEGKPLLSWRVHVLPFLEQNKLYEQFHLDEPWDSDHNKKLIKLMPDVYRSPSVSLAVGKTVYLGVAGNGGIFSDKKIGFSQITDGSSNTALVVEANEQLAVEWTKPQDYECDQKNPLSGVGGVQPSGFIAAFCDGSTHFIQNSIDPNAWKWITQMSDGNIPNW